MSLMLKGDGRTAAHHSGSVQRVRRLTEGEIERGITALVPFAQEWGLPLNPEDLQAMAVAVLTHTYSDETLDEIDAAERQWIKEDREAHDRLVVAMAEALEKRPGSEARMHYDELTEEELTIIEGRAAAATPGPWKSFAEGRDHTGGDDFIRTGGLDDACPDLYLRHDSPERTGVVPAPVEDQDFIAHARQDVPRLVVEVRRLRELNAHRPA
jgi:hypothetical protein